MTKQTNNAWIVAAVIGAAALILLALSSIGTNRNASAADPAAAAAAPAALPGADKAAQPPPVPNPAPQGAPAPLPAGAVSTASGLQYVDEVVGSGAQPQPGQTVVVHYSGYLDNGLKFDSSRDRNDPLKFKLGTRAVIQGWDEGIATMKVGGKRKLIIPPSLGYGANGNGRIPPNARLTFDVELLGVE